MPIDTYTQDDLVKEAYLNAAPGYSTRPDFELNQRHLNDSDFNNAPLNEANLIAAEAAFKLGEENQVDTTLFDKMNAERIARSHVAEAERVADMQTPEIESEVSAARQMAEYHAGMEAMTVTQTAEYIHKLSVAEVVTRREMTGHRDQFELAA